MERVKRNENFCTKISMSSTSQDSPKKMRHSKKSRVRHNTPMSQEVGHCHNRTSPAAVNVLSRCDFLNVIWPAEMLLVAIQVCKLIRSEVLPRLKSADGSEIALRLVAQMRVGSRRNQTWPVDFTYIMGVRLEVRITNPAGLRSFCEGLLKAVKKGWQGPASIDISPWVAGISKSEGIGCEIASLLPGALKHCKNLGRLKLDGCCLSNRSVAKIAKVLPCCKSLSRISLRDNSFGDGGTRALSRSLPLCASLEHLDLSNNVIGDSGCTALISAVPRSRALTGLVFGGNGIGRRLCLRLQDALDLRRAATAPGDGEDSSGCQTPGSE
mmetsp:Transcript_7083/g.15328  ORF Transcript_7083/g.15328 Transcript_7083/m.15328 type:complete len:326 (-) Transcript_7083:172-1149(-)